MHNLLYMMMTETWCHSNSFGVWHLLFLMLLLWSVNSFANSRLVTGNTVILRFCWVGMSFTANKLPSETLPTNKRRKWTCSEWRKFPTAICSKSDDKRINEYVDILQCLPCKLSNSKKKFVLMKTFSSIHRYSKKKREISFLEKKAEFMRGMDELFDIFCFDD